MNRLTRFSPIPTGWLSSRVATICAKYVNLYLCRYQGGFIAFDTGFSVSLAAGGLQSLSIPAETVTHVFLTHSDYDHVGGLGAFPQAKVYLAAAEESVASGRIQRAPLYRNKLQQAVEYFDFPFALNLGELTIRGIHAPGHTPGSTVYQVNDEMLFVGDAILLQNGKPIRFFPLFNMDSRQHRQSLAMLRGMLVGQQIFTAHAGICFDLPAN
jgi:glyoxylase-like metal-dependent hydrolase (beta-lactamase superfamily II)